MRKIQLFIFYSALYKRNPKRSADQTTKTRTCREHKNEKTSFSLKIALFTRIFVIFPKKKSLAPCSSHVQKIQAEQQQQQRPQRKSKHNTETTKREEIMGILKDISTRWADRRAKKVGISRLGVCVRCEWRCRRFCLGYRRDNTRIFCLLANLEPMLVFQRVAVSFSGGS